jgi:hypothetical protein
MEIKIKEQDVKAITSAIYEGKYSLACLLTLRALRINPQGYFPTRTFYRVLDAEKEIRENT